MRGAWNCKISPLKKLFSTWSFELDAGSQSSKTSLTFTPSTMTDSNLPSPFHSSLTTRIRIRIRIHPLTQPTHLAQRRRFT